MSVFTMLMTIPQVLSIWIGQQAAGGFYLHVERLPGFRHPLVMVRTTEKRQEHLLAMLGLDRARPCCDHRSNHLWITWLRLPVDATANRIPKEKTSGVL